MQDHTHHEEMNHHEMMMKEFKKKTGISLVLTVLVLLLSPTIQGWLNISLPHSKITDLLLIIFSSIIVLYGASPFFK